MPVACSCRTPAGTPWESYVRVRGGQVLRALALARCELSLSLVGDDEMRVLNRTYRGRDRPTDVLAFAFAEEGGTRHPTGAGRRARRGRRNRNVPTAAPALVARRLLGDVVISIDTAVAQARVSRCALATRVDALLIHGVLHLIGYDHEVSPAEERRMTRRARAVRRSLASEPRPPAPGATAGARAARS